jgi:hypothetical protein
MLWEIAGENQRSVEGKWDVRIADVGMILWSESSIRLIMFEQILNRYVEMQDHGNSLDSFLISEYKE